MTSYVPPQQSMLTRDIQRANAALPEEDAGFLAKFLYSEGYRHMEPQPVTDPEILDQYPVGTVIRLLDDQPPHTQIWQRVAKSSYCWSSIGISGRFTSETVLHRARFTGAAAVLYEPMAPPCR